MIEDYHFGSITINGKTYDHDVEVRWNGEVLKWWRNRGHVFAIDDLKRAVKEEPEIIILGTGAYGTAKVNAKAKKFIQDKEIKLIIDKTEPAVESFNTIIKSKEETPQKVIGLFHLTC